MWYDTQIRTQRPMMKKRFLLLLVPTLSLGLYAKETPAEKAPSAAEATADAPEGEVTLKEIFNHRSFWPATITLTKDQAIEMKKTDGSGTLDVDGKTGDSFKLSGVSKTGVKIRNDDAMAYIPLEGTSLINDIEAKMDGKKLARVLPEPEPDPAAIAASGDLPASMAKVLPDELVDSTGAPLAPGSLAGKFIGVYFSAHWCPPCRGFTPSLVKFRNANADDFEVIFVSSDRTEAAMLGYMKEYNMQFAAAKYRSAGQTKLSKQFAARGIPHLVILAPDGRVITTNGRADISSKGDAALDAWKAGAGK